MDTQTTMSVVSQSPLTAPAKERPTVQPYPIELLPGLYQLSGGAFRAFSIANVYLLMGRWPTLIDCGAPEDIPVIEHSLAHLGMTFGDIVRIVATHGHWDHVAAYGQLKAKYPHLSMLLHSGDWRAWREYDAYSTCSYLYGKSPDVVMYSDEWSDVPKQVKAGNGAWLIIPTPGHSEGSVCLLGKVAGWSVLLAGDTFRGAMLKLRGANLEAWQRASDAWETSLTTLLTYPFDLVYWGHGTLREQPFTRAQFAEEVAHFGWMLNPWYCAT